MTYRPDGWLEVPEIEDIPLPSPPRVPVKDILQEVPEEGSKRKRMSLRILRVLALRLWPQRFWGSWRE
jgi:hypothetical protein